MKLSNCRVVLALIACLVTLQGCITSAFVIGTAAGAAGSSIVYDRRSIDTIKQDLSIGHLAKKRLKALNQHNRIVVASFDHIVLLTGQVSSEAVRKQAQEIVTSIPNIKQVYNELRVAGPIAPLTQSSDAWITTKIKTHMLATKGLHSSQVKVVTENGTVYLMGLVTRTQARMAVDIARRVYGVQRVVKIFEYE